MAAIAVPLAWVLLQLWPTSMVLMMRWWELTEESSRNSFAVAIICTSLILSSLSALDEKEEEGGSSLLDCTVSCIKKLRSLPPFLCILLVVFVVLYWFYISVLGGINFAKLPDYQLEASLK